MILFSDFVESGVFGYFTKDSCEFLIRCGFCRFLRRFRYEEVGHLVGYLAGFLVPGGKILIESLFSI
jgi:hypothetical protein